jgi:hypothetical protein
MTVQNIGVIDLTECGIIDYLEKLNITEDTKIKEWCDNNLKINRSSVIINNMITANQVIVPHIVENEYNKIIIKEKCGHLCHLETQICL